MRLKAGYLWLLFGLAGCTMGPDYRKPSPTVPDHWQAEKNASSTIKPITPEKLKAWWQSFNDARLNHLMVLALAGNLDLKMTLARIDQARADRRSTRAEFFPQIGLKSGAQRNLNLSPIYSRGLSYNLFELGFDALWEIDVFGRQQRRLEAATADLDAAEETHAQALVTLSAELVRSYIEYRSLQNQLRITQANLAAQQHTQQLTDQLFKEGVGTRHDVVRARAQAENTEAQIPSLNGQMIAALRQLEMLTGKPPGALAADLAEPSAIPTAPKQALLASPAATIRHRPDLIIAERKLAASTALHGAAIAELFPKISLSAFLGLRNTDIESLFKSAAFSYSTGANLLQPLLNFGRIRAGIDLAEARQQEAYLAYEKAVLEALHETETSLTRYLKEEVRRQILVRAVDDQRESVRLSQLRYQEGVSSFLDVLDAQRALYAAEIELARSETEAATSLIAFYKALGGGANATSAEVAPKSTG